MTDSPTPTVTLGIDLGTTNSLAAIQTKKGPKVLRDRDGNALIPSVVHYGQDGAIIVGQQARALQLKHPERTVSSVKRLVGRSAEEARGEAERTSYQVVEGDRGLARVAIDDQGLAPEQVSAEILKTVRDRAAEALGTEIDAAVITVPAYFDDTQRQATKDAAELAGLRCLRILNEPTAASLAYGIDGTKDGTVLVYDLGGGTFDVSVLKIRDGVFQVLATAGDTHLGGDDFDHVLVDRIHEVLAERDLHTEGLSSEVRQAIRSGAEGIKCQLSAEDEAALTLALSTEEVSLKVTRADFEARIAPLVDRTLAHCQAALKDAGLAFADVDDVVLVGGSTRVPLVQRRLAETSGKALNTDVDPDLAVAQGAAIQADSLAGGERAHLLLDVIPLSLGLETMGGAMSKLILRNATIPTSQMEEFSTQVDNQTAVDLNIYQGERELVDQCRHLGSFKLRGIPPMPAGLPRIEVTFLVDADGVLRVRAKETRTRAEASIQVVPSFGLTRDEVRRMMTDSIEHAHEDMALREDLEVRNKAQAMVRGTTRALELSDLPPDQTWSIQKAAKALGQLLETEAPLDQIRPAVDDLSELTASVADDVISSAVHKALTEDA